MPRARKTSALTLVSQAAALVEHLPEADVDAAAGAGAVTIPDTRDCRSLALGHAPAAIEVLAKIMNGDGSEASRIAAANAMLDRAYGKARVGSVAAGGEAAEAVRETRLTVLFV